MKRKIIIILVMCILGLLVCCVMLDPNREFMINEIKSVFKPTVYLNYEKNIAELDRVEVFGGAATMQSADELDYIYTDKNKIQKIIGYLNKIPLVKADRRDVPSKSADVMISFYDVNGEMVGSIWVYGQVFIENRNTGEMYRSRDETIIDGLEALNFK